MRFPITSPGSTPRPARRDRGAFRLPGLAVAAALAAAVAAPAWAAGPTLLPADQAFRLSARALDASSLEIRFDVADGYYLYRDKLKFAVEPAAAGGASPALPPGKVIEDEFFGRVATYRGPVVIRLPLAAGKPGASVTLTVDSQGCADAGVCYPATRQKLTLTLPEPGKGPGPVVEATPRKKNWFN